MAFIVEHYASDRALQIGIEDVLRKLSFGTNWQRIRIGVRAAMYYNGFNLPGNYIGPILGLCTGPQGSMGASTTDCIFMNFFHYQTGTYAGTPPNVYYDVGSSGWTQVTYQRVGSTTNNSSGFGGIRACISANPTALTSFFALDVTKGTIGASTYTGIWYCQINSQITTNFTRTSFLAALMTDGTPTGTTAIAPGANCYCGLRTTKDWDHFFVGHRRCYPALNIYDMAVVRFS